MIILFSVLLLVFIFLFCLVREWNIRRVQNEFIAIVTHKFRTPLTGIRWSIDMIQKDLTLLEKKDLLMEMQKANERLMEIVDLLVGFAKFDKQVDHILVAVYLREIVEISLNKYSALIKTKEIKIHIDSGGEPALVLVDKAKIQFVVDMLIDNALKYTPKDGTISVVFEADRKFIVMKVKDSGIGFGYFEGLRIFRHFFRSKSAKLLDAEGLGLGLYTARKIVGHHRGKLWAESAGPNKGATFSLRLPIKR